MATFSTILTLPSASVVVSNPTRQNEVQQRFYRPELDVLRLGAFCAVFLHHAIYTFSPTLSRFGAFGLSLFFLLSAYLITELLQREKSAKGVIDARSFYIRRALRIWPLYYGFLALTLLIGTRFPGHRGPWLFILSFILMCGNFYVGKYGFPNNSASFLWSISVEEQFYLIWPLLNQYCGRRRLAWIAMGAFPVAGVTIVLLATARSASNLSIWSNPLVEFQMFAWGVLLSLGLRLYPPRLATWHRLALLAGGICLWMIAARWCGVDDSHMPGVVPLLIGYVLVGIGCSAMFLSIYGVRSHRLPAAFVYLGRISYGLYVFHELCLEFASWLLNRSPITSSASHHAVYGVTHIVLSLLFTIAVSVVSYKCYETPFLKMKERFAIVRSRAV